MNNAIGVFDSGVGGLTVAREIMRQLPNETIYYFGDVKNCPYGDKKKDEIIINTEKAIKYLINQGVKMIILACNTATAAALEYLQEKYDLPIIGVVQPGARRAIQATENNKVLVLGTKFTTTSEVYDIEIQNINSDIVVYDKACPSFVPFIESEGYLNKEEADNIIKETLNDTIDLGMDTVVLGCTHYPMLKKNIEEFYGNRIKVISSGREAAREVSTVLGYSKLHQSKVNKTEHKFFISAKSENTFEENALIKARTIAKFAGKTAIADDSGLAIDLLDGRPGVFSARYSKEQTDEKNIEKVLFELDGNYSKAKFVSVIAYVTPDGVEKTFRGECHGEIIFEKRGKNGFGYDPIFYVPELDKTFAEITSEEKNSISHRSESLKKFSNYLREQDNED